MSFRYALTVAYKGTAFCGWQTQKKGRSVSRELEITFKRVFGADIKLIGASRTDAGVHARAQVALFTTERDYTPEQLLYAWNNTLSDDITITSVTYADAAFHPRRAVAQKTYWYHLFLERPLPFYKPYGLYIAHPVDLVKLQDALALFVGEHDFRSFCSNKDGKSTIRTVDAITLEYDDRMHAYRIIVQAKGFLHHMVRRMVGAALHIARYPDATIEPIAHALEHPNAQQTLPNAPAHGLMLANIIYTKENR